MLNLKKYIKENHIIRTCLSLRITASLREVVYISNYYQAFDRETQRILKIVFLNNWERNKKNNSNIKNIMPPQLMRFSKGSFFAYAC